MIDEVIQKKANKVLKILDDGWSLMMAMSKAKVESRVQYKRVTELIKDQPVYKAAKKRNRSVSPYGVKNADQT